MNKAAETRLKVLRFSPDVPPASIYERIAGKTVPYVDVPERYLDAQEIEFAILELGLKTAAKSVAEVRLKPGRGGYVFVGVEEPGAPPHNL